MNVGKVITHLSRFIITNLIEMAQWVVKFAQMDTNELDARERNLVAVAFKYQAGSRRAAWRVLGQIQRRENNKGASENVQWIKEYKT